MTQIEQIRNKIEKLSFEAKELSERYRNSNNDFFQYYGGKHDGYRIALSLLDTLK